MTLVFMEKHKCKKCRTVFDRPKLMSISVFDDAGAERVEKLREESKKGCPECGSDELELIPPDKYFKDREKKRFWDFLKKKRRKH